MAEQVNIVGAPAWYPQTTPIPDDDVIVQIAGKRPGRTAIAIENIGTDDAKLYAVNDASSGFITLLPGNSVLIDTTAEAYASSTNGTTLQTMETVVPPATGGTGADMPRYYDAVK